MLVCYLAADNLAKDGESESPLEPVDKVHSPSSGVSGGVTRSILIKPSLNYVFGDAATAAELTTPSTRVSRE